MNKNILESKVDNKVKNYENYLKPQWSWKTLISIVLFCSILIFVVKDLEIDFLKLLSDSYKYFGDIFKFIKGQTVRADFSKCVYQWNFDLFNCNVHQLNSFIIWCVLCCKENKGPEKDYFFKQFLYIYISYSNRLILHSRRFFCQLVY